MCTYFCIQREILEAYSPICLTVIKGLWDAEMLTVNSDVLRVVSDLNEHVCQGWQCAKHWRHSLIFPALLGGCFHFHLAGEESEAESSHLPKVTQLVL